MILLLAFILLPIGLVLMSMRPMGADRFIFPKCDPVEKLRELTLGIKSKETRRQDACFLIGPFCFFGGISAMLFWRRANGRLPFRVRSFG